jgi:hypothetical protein
MGILPGGGEWRRRGAGITLTMKGTSGDYSTTMAARSGSGRDELGEGMDESWIGSAHRPFYRPGGGSGGSGWCDVMAGDGGIEKL